MSRLYIIGPVTGVEDDNRPEFEQAFWELNGVGHATATPFMADGMCLANDWGSCMLASVHELTNLRNVPAKGGRLGTVAPFYDGVAMLDGWEQSKGATIEHDLAVALGIPCRPWREWLSAEGGEPCPTQASGGAGAA